MIDVHLNLHTIDLAYLECIKHCLVGHVSHIQIFEHMGEVEVQKARSRDRGDQQSAHEHRGCGVAEIMKEPRKVRRELLLRSSTARWQGYQ
jgi:hypothetical protein